MCATSEQYHACALCVTGISQVVAIWTHWGHWVQHMDTLGLAYEHIRVGAPHPFSLSSLLVLLPILSLVFSVSPLLSRGHALAHTRCCLCREIEREREPERDSFIKLISLSGGV